MPVGIQPLWRTIRKFLTKLNILFPYNPGIVHLVIYPIFFLFAHIFYHKHSAHECFSSVQLLSCARLFATPRTAACQASLSITNSQSLLKLMSIESVMPSNHLILCHPLLLLPSLFRSIRVFSNESVLHIRLANVLELSASASVLPTHIQD